MSTPPQRGRDPYVFQDPKKRFWMGVLDAIGGALTRPWGMGRQRVDLKRVPDPDRILVVRLDHIGDVLYTRPALQALRKRFPGARITVLVSPAVAGLMQADPNIDEVWPWTAPWFDRSNARHGFNELFGLWRQLRRRRFDLSLELRGDLRHHVLLALAGVRLRVGYGITGGRFLLHLCPNLRPGVHEVERDLDLVAVLGGRERPRVYTPLSVEAELPAALAASKAQGRVQVMLHPAAGVASKCWPPERFGQVAGTLARSGCEVWLVGSAQDRALCDQVAQAAQAPLQRLDGQWTLRQLAAGLREMDLFIGNNSGPGHLAVTQGVPSVILWLEADDPVEWGPWGNGAESVVISDPLHPQAVSKVLTAAQRLSRRSIRF